MELIISIFVCVLVSVFIGIQLVNGIDYMHKNHPDYKGEDLFDEDLETNNDPILLSDEDTKSFFDSLESETEPNEVLKEAAKKSKK
jgi:hypothetical protein